LPESKVSNPPFLPGALFLSALKNMMQWRKAILAAIVCVVAAMSAYAQDVSRFEIGGTFNTLRNDNAGLVGPGFRGVFNLGRFVSLEGEFNWFPITPSGSRSGTTIEGLFGAKVGYRTQHFGIFGKVRPGFLSSSDSLRQINIDLSTIVTPETFRFNRLTERVVDFGEVLEYYPSKHWAFRWDIGDTVIFREEPRFNVINGGNLFVPIDSFNRTTNNFQFTTGVQYRF